MKGQLSHGIVTFISHLLPLYVGERSDGVWGARSLSDGTLILPLDEEATSDKFGDGFVLVRWQGDPARESLVQGVYMASLAIARYVELHHIATQSKVTQAEMDHLSRHFKVKTGESLVFEQSDFRLLEILGKAVGKVGEAAIIEILKKQVGL